jgi:hypothetical protein
MDAVNVMRIMRVVRFMRFTTIRIAVILWVVVSSGRSVV